MNTDIKNLYEIINVLDKISAKMNSELLKLKKKINYISFQSPLKNYHIEFLQNILIPLSKQKSIFSLEDIKLMLEKTKSLKESSIRCYLSVLYRKGCIKIKKNQDKRHHSYELA